MVNDSEFSIGEGDWPGGVQIKFEIGSRIEIRAGIGKTNLRAFANEVDLLAAHEYIAAKADYPG